MLVNLFSMWISESDLETEPTEPGPLGKKAPQMRADNELFTRTGEMTFLFDFQTAERSSIPAPDFTLFTNHANSVSTTFASTGS